MSNLAGVPGVWSVVEMRHRPDFDVPSGTGDRHRPTTVEDIEPSGSGRDETLWAALSDHLPRLGRFALGLTGSRDAADELVAEAIARTLPKWRDGRVLEPVAYVRRVMVNQASRRWRRRDVARRLDHHALDWQRPAADASAAFDERDRTLAAVLKLPVRRRAIVLMRFYDDLAVADIAAQLGVRDGTVKSQLSRALADLRRELAEQPDREEGGLHHHD